MVQLPRDLILEELSLCVCSGVPKGSGTPTAPITSWEWLVEGEVVEPRQCPELWSAEPTAALLLTLRSGEINGLNEHK